ncbi:hypothetical protein [Jiulongibacter sediminis]|jgi:hypothetical protein|uniref:hypothetical protein n=1 Tax=Jiulongibacter sediminis TaxID=1605367 RepID=UPI0026F2FBF4|nr:hypothetical protein [Jiulongibacter sediminis]
MKWSGIKIALFVFVACTLRVSGQASFRVEIIIPEAAQIRLKPGTANTINFNFASENQLESGLTSGKAATLQVSSNRLWVASAQAESPYFTITETGDLSDMPSTVLSLRAGTGLTPYLPLSTVGVPLKTGAKGLFGGQNEFDVDFKASPSHDQQAGSYVMNVLFTVSPQ